ncbi:MAG: copper amine oxidase N-terminal domain-containing protein [Clostridiales bacterium]|jgi:hypothetical protein|nr:copper amine oxidase N-terminal domain-containing protein [Clostridiales bacterium]
MKKIKNVQMFVMGLVVGLLLVGTTVFAATAIASATFNDTRVIFNGEVLDLPQPLISVILEGQTNVINYMPVRAVLEAMGYVVDWDGENNAILVSTPQIEQLEQVTLDGFVPLLDFAMSHDIDVDSRVGFRRGDIELVLPVNWVAAGGAFYVATAEGRPDISVTVIVHEYRTMINEAEITQALRAVGLMQ